MKLKIEKDGDAVRVEFTPDGAKKPVAVTLTPAQVEMPETLLRTAPPP